jgi:hypothetical protein
LSSESSIMGSDGVMSEGSIHTLISGYGNLYSGFFWI